MKARPRKGRDAARVLSCMLAIALVTLVGLLQSASAVGPAPKPDWTPGDFWEYRSSENFLNHTFTYVDRVDVTAIENVTVHAETWRAYNTTERWQVLGGPQPTGYTLQQWFRTSDLASVQIHWPGYFDSNYDPPPEIHWPLSVGMAWNGSTTETLVAMGQSRVSTYPYRFAVSDGGVRATPAGSFDILQLREDFPNSNSTQAEVTYYSASVGNAVLHQVPTLPDQLLTTFRFQRSPSPLFLLMGIVGFSTAVAVVAVSYGLLRSRRATGEGAAKIPPP